MIKKSILPLILLLLSVLQGVSAQKIINGFVYNDVNGSNTKEKSEKGIPYVGISNGVEVVLTDKNGRYEIPVTTDSILFVIKPSDYDVPVNEYNLPQYYYIFKGRDISSTPLNFALISKKPEENFKILVFGDPQPSGVKDLEFFKNGIVGDIKNASLAKFGISMGDLAGECLTLADPYKKAISSVGIPWYHVMGNHDMDMDAGSDLSSDRTFEKEFGPSTYSFNYGKVHFIILDDINYPDPRDKKGYWGGFREDQFTFIKNDLALVPKDFLVVLAFHIQISESSGEDVFDDEDRLKLFSLLEGHPNTLSISAHTHYQGQHFFGSDEGWNQAGEHHHFNIGTTCGDWYSGKIDNRKVPLATMRDGTPSGYAYINFEGSTYTIDYKAAGKPQDYYFEITAPKVVERNKGTTAGIYTNFFMGSEKDSLFYRVDDGQWVPMRQVWEMDPAYLHLLHEWDYTEELLPGRRPSNPMACSHLWRGSIPANLASGEHIIEIKAKDMFGRTLTQKSSYKVADPKSN